MKKWDAREWCMFILACTIPLSILMIPILRLIGGFALSDNASSVINNLLTAIGVGLLSIISSKKNSSDG